MARRQQNEFLESAEVHGNFYGTSRILISKEMEAGTDVLLEIDWQGAQHNVAYAHGRFAAELGSLPEDWAWGDDVVLGEEGISCFSSTFLHAAANNAIPSSKIIIFFIIFLYCHTGQYDSV